MSTEVELPPLSERLAETVRGFWHLGLTAFGGPGERLGTFLKDGVDSLQGHTSSFCTSFPPCIFGPRSDVFAAAAGSSRTGNGSTVPHSQISLHSVMLFLDRVPLSWHSVSPR